MRAQRLIRPVRRLFGIRSDREGPGQSESNRSHASGSDRDAVVGAIRADGGAAGERESARQEGTRTETAVGAAALLETMADPAFLLAPDGTVVAWNDSVAGVSGVDATRAVGQDGAGALFYPDREDEETLAELVLAAPADAAEEFGHVVRDGSAYTHEEWIPDADGEDRYFDHRAGPLYEDGDLAGVVQYSRERTTSMRRQEAVAHFVFEPLGVRGHRRGRRARRRGHRGSFPGHRRPGRRRRRTPEARSTAPNVADPLTGPRRTARTSCRRRPPGIEAVSAWSRSGAPGSVRLQGTDRTARLAHSIGPFRPHIRDIGPISVVPLQRTKNRVTLGRGRRRRTCHTAGYKPMSNFGSPWDRRDWIDAIVDGSNIYPFRPRVKQDFPRSTHLNTRAMI